MKRKLLPLIALIFGLMRVNAQQAVGVLDINNIHCNVSATGDLFYDFGDEALPGFEVPAGSGLRTIYAGNLWVAGLSLDEQLKVAAETYGIDGQDWFTGPLTTDGSAEISAEDMDLYNQVWVANLADVETHLAYFDALAEGVDDVLFPEGYTIPQWMFDWPAHGNTSTGQDFYLAPFYDSPYSEPGIYDPENGDTPLFCGEQCLYFIFNDKGGPHTESQGQPIGLEIHGMLYAFNSTESDMLNNTIFLKYKIINRGTQTLIDTYVGLWTDFDLGNPQDDYIGTNVMQGSVYSYNGDEVDNDGYEEDLPMQSLTILAGPSQDMDEMDNPLTDNAQDAIENLGVPYANLGWGYGDGIADNERMGLTSSLYHSNGTNPIDGWPSAPAHYYNYLDHKWKNGAEIMANDQIPYAYFAPDDSDPLYWGSGGEAIEILTESDAGNPPGDRRMLSSMGQFTLSPGDVQYVDAAFVFARESDDEVDGNVATTFEERIIEAHQFYDDYLINCNGQSIPLPHSELNSVGAFSIYPNPVSNQFTLHLSDQMRGSTMQLFDAVGQLVLEQNLSDVNTAIQTAHLGSGIYLITVQKDDTKYVQRFVVQ